MGKIKIEGYVCERCSHQWVPRNSEMPRVCPKCKSPYWDVPRKQKKKLKKKTRGKKKGMKIKTKVNRRKNDKSC